jgi:hypothetical protein
VQVGRSCSVLRFALRTLSADKHEADPRPGTQPDEINTRGCCEICNSASSYFPSRSTLSFSFSFICLMVGSRGASPVVWVVVAGGAVLGTELCP